MESISLRELKKLRERAKAVNDELKRKEALFERQDAILKEKNKTLKSRADDVNIEKAKAKAAEQRFVDDNGKDKKSK